MSNLVAILCDDTNFTYFSEDINKVLENDKSYVKVDDVKDIEQLVENNDITLLYDAGTHIETLSNKDCIDYCMLEENEVVVYKEV